MRKRENKKTVQILPGVGRSLDQDRSSANPKPKGNDIMSKHIADSSSPIQERICVVESCNKLGQNMGKYYKTGDKKGLPYRRARCHTHHKIHQGEKKGMTANQWMNSFHRYKKHRKEYCENIDGRLGFICTTTIIDKYYQLEVDHIDENHKNNDPCNLQTLCACCHRIKTKYRRTKFIELS